MLIISTTKHVYYLNAQHGEQTDQNIQKQLWTSRINNTHQQQGENITKLSAP